MKRLISLTLAVILSLSGFLAACQKEIPETTLPPGLIDIETDGTEKKGDNEPIEDVEIPGLIEDEEDDEPPLVFFPDDGTEVPPWQDDEVIIIPPDDEEPQIEQPIDDEYNCLCGCQEDNCGCDYICTNPEHSNYIPPKSPFIDFSGSLFITLALPDGQMVKDAAMSGLYAEDGYGNDVTDEIKILSVDDQIIDESFDWDARAAQFGRINIELFVENSFGLSYSLVRRITVVDIPQIEFSYDSFVTEEHQGEQAIVIYAGDSFDPNPALTVTDGYDDISVTNNVVINWGGFSTVTAGFYKIVFTVTNSYNYWATTQCFVLVKPSPTPTFSSSEPLNFVIAKTTGSVLKEACLSGIGAVDGLGNDISSQIIIKSVNGVAVNEDYDWMGRAMTVGQISVVLSVTNSYNKTHTITRLITIADVPSISVDYSGFEIKDGYIYLYIYDSFSLENALSISDASDPALGVEDIVVSGSVNTLVSGKYTLVLNAKNVYGISAKPVEVKVWVDLPQEATLSLEGNTDFVLTVPTGTQLRAAALNGLSAKDGLGNDISSQIEIKAVDGVQIDQNFDWDACAATFGTIRVLLSVVDPYHEVECSIERRITIADIPVLTFDYTSYETTEIEGKTVISIMKKSEFDKFYGINVFDRSDSALQGSEASVEITFDGFVVADIDVGVVGLYKLVYQIANCYGQTSQRLTVYVYINALTPVFELTEGTASNVIIAKSNADNFRAAALEGVTAHDGENNDLTNEIVIKSVDGKENGTFDWNQYGANLGTFEIVLCVYNQDGKINYFSRTITVVDIPVISFDSTKYETEESRIRVFTGGSFDYLLGLSIFDASDSSLTKNDIAVEGSVNTLVPGTYTLTFSAQNTYGINAQPLSIVVRVRDKVVTDYTVYEIYDTLQVKLQNSYYTSYGENKASWDGGSYSKYGFYHYTKTVNNANEYSHLYMTSGWQYYFILWGDFNRANEFKYNKNTGTMTLQTAKVEKYSSRSEFRHKDNGTWNVGNQWNSASSSSIQGFESHFGRPFMQDSPYNITPQTANGTLKVLGANEYEVSFEIIIQNKSRSSEGLKGRMSFLNNLMNNVSFDTTDRAVLTYKFDSNFKVLQKTLDERYQMNIDYAAIYATVSSVLTENYVYDANQPAAPLAMETRIMTAPLTQQVEQTPEPQSQYEYCACGCCECCLDCFPEEGRPEPPVPEDTRKSPIITINEELVFKKGQTVENFKMYLYTGISADDGYGNNALTSVRLYEIDGKKISDSDFRWEDYIDAVGQHTVTYYLVNEVNKYIMQTREFTVASVPKIEFVYTGSRVDVLPVVIDGTSVNVNHIVVLIGSEFDPLGNVRATDEYDLEISKQSIFFSGEIDSQKEGVYSLSFWAVNSFGISSPKRTAYFNVRNILPTELTYGLDAYELVAQTTANSIFSILTKGSSDADGNKLVVYGTREHNGDETFFQNISNGGSIFGINCDFARKAYRKGDVYRRSNAEGGFSTSAGIVTVKNWGTPWDTDANGYENEFGRKIDDLSNYLITPTSVSNPKSGILNNGDGSFTISFSLKVDKGLDSEGIKGYAKNQLPTMSGGKTCKSFEYATVTIKFDTKFRALEIKVMEKYVVNTGIFISPTATTTTETTDTFTYHSSLKVTSF